MQRIAIIGSPGSGKSTLAQEMGKALDLPVHHLDRLFWRPGWVAPERPAWVAVQEELVKGERWIIDGNYGGTMPIRLGAADTVIFLDLPRLLCLWRAVRRLVQYRRSGRPDMAEGCEERLSWEFLRYIWAFPKQQRPRVRELLGEVGPPKRVIHLQRVREVEEFRRLLYKGQVE
ncbi:MAG: DNA topology modulation protein [Bacillota bacterium]